MAHCGHPTANWPYFLEHPDRPEIIVAYSGHGFKTSTIARIVVERILAGELEISTIDCAPGIATVNVNGATGERIPQ